MRMICEAALQNSNIVMASESAAADEVDVALVEAGREHETAKLMALCEKYPRARIIAIGQPLRPESFGAVTPMLIKADLLRAALNLKAAA